MHRLAGLAVAVAALAASVAGCGGGDGGKLTALRIQVSPPINK